MSAKELLHCPESVPQPVRAAHGSVALRPVPDPCPLPQVHCVAARRKMFLHLKEWLHTPEFPRVYFFDHTAVFLGFGLGFSEGLCFLFKLWLSQRSQSLLPVLGFLL